MLKTYSTFQLYQTIHGFHRFAKYDVFTSLVKSRVIDYWETIIRAEADALSSLKYFKAQCMSQDYR